jgi:uncharacterized RDD family membrane protein YckC
MQPNSRPSASNARSVLLVVACVFAILVVFLLLLAIGNYIPQLGNTGFSVLYSLIVYIPVAMVCALAISRQR